MKASVACAQRVVCGTHMSWFVQALGISKETYVRINCEGMLSVQHQVDMAIIFDLTRVGSSIGTCS